MGYRRTDSQGIPQLVVWIGLGFEPLALVESPLKWGTLIIHQPVVKFFPACRVRLFEARAVWQLYLVTGIGGVWREEGVLLVGALVDNRGQP